MAWSTFSWTNGTAHRYWVGADVPTSGPRSWTQATIRTPLTTVAVRTPAAVALRVVPGSVDRAPAGLAS
jgi:hypothetical protein